MSMAQVIEFHTLARFTPTVKWPPDEQRGQVIPFMSQWEVSDELVCVVHEELDSEPSRRRDRDEARYHAALEQAAPLRLEEEPLLENSSNAMTKRSLVSPILRPFSNDSLSGS